MGQGTVRRPARAAASGGERLSVERLRRVLTLIHEGAEIPDRAEQEHHLLAGLCRIVGGDVAVAFEFGDPTSGRPTAGFAHGLDAGERTAMFSAYMGSGDDFDTMAGQIRDELAGASPLLTRMRRDVFDDHAWYRSSYLNEFRRSWRIDDCVYSCHQIGAGLYGMSLNRAFGSSPFSGEERELVRVFHQESAWLVRTRPRAPQPPPALLERRAALAPRPREVLDGLLRGAADKEIAADLGLSSHTVRQYVKTIFRAFDVSSRTELVARWSGRR